MIAYRWTSNNILKEDAADVEPPPEDSRPERTVMRRRAPCARGGPGGGGAQGAGAGEDVELEYPSEGETIWGDSYTFRIRAPAAARRIELSINHGPWQICRHAAGYWWFDWAGFKSGEYLARSRAHLPEGRLELPWLRRFRVRNPA